MPVLYDSRTEDATTGTRLLQEGLKDRLDEDYQSRAVIGRNIHGLSAYPGKRVYWTHNNPWDERERRAPEETEEEYYLLPTSRWDKIDEIVFTSNWQKQKYIEAYELELRDLDKLHVIPNGITPIPESSISKSTDGQVRLIYASPPDRGLMLLYAAFTRLVYDNPNLVLDVYSSWEQLGISTNSVEVSHTIVDKCQEHPNINYHGNQPHEVVLDAMAKADILAYPSMFPEVTGMPLVEAMSAKCICVHPTGAALSETSFNSTFSYETNKFHKDHVETFIKQMQIAIDAVNTGNTSWFNLDEIKRKVDEKHNWDTVVDQWKALIDK
jgi:glycosyltransferase involved in cell wall biosynthesis